MIESDFRLELSTRSIFRVKYLGTTSNMLILMNATSIIAYVLELAVLKANHKE